MKRLLNIKFFALLIGAGLAFAGTVESSEKVTTYTYGRLSNGMWINLDPSNYECGTASSTCKGNFTYQNPPQNAIPDAGVGQQGVYRLK